MKLLNYVKKQSKYCPPPNICPQLSSLHLKVWIVCRQAFWYCKVSTVPVSMYPLRWCLKDTRGSPVEIEILGALAAFGFGWIFLRPLAPETGCDFIAAAALPIGVALWVLSSMLLLLSLKSFDPAHSAMLALLIGMLVNVSTKVGVTRRELIFAAGGALVIAAFAGIFAAFEWSVFNSDMVWTLYMADDLIDHGVISDNMRRTQLGADPLYLAFVSAFVRLSGEYYAVSLSPLMMLCTMALFVIFTVRAAMSGGLRGRGTRILIGVLGAGAFLSSGYFVNTALQVKTHSVYALHMLGACGAFYFAAVEGSRRWFAAGLMFAAPMVMFRLESGLAGLPVLVVALAITSIPLRQRLWGVGLVFIMWAAAYFCLLVATTYYDGMIDRGYVSKNILYTGALDAVAGGLLVLLAAASRHGLITGIVNGLVTFLPALMAITLAVLLAIHVVVFSDIYAASAKDIAAIIADPSMGGVGFSIAAGLLLLLSLVMRGQLPWLWVVLVPVVSFLITVLLADVHLEGHPHWGMTGALTRIMSHVIPTLAFYVVLRIVVMLNDVSTTELQSDT